MFLGMQLKVAMGLLSLLIMFLAYAIFLTQIAKGNKRPHPMTWFGFALCTGAGYLVQIHKGAGAGSWVMGWTALFCLLIGAAGWLKGVRHFDRFDKWSFGLGLAAFGAWTACYLLNLDPTMVAVFATVSDLLLYGPSIKKGWRLPHEDSAMAYFLNSQKFVPALLALNTHAVATWLYPVALVVANGGMCVYIISREAWLAKDGSASGMRLLYEVLFVERGIDQTKHPQWHERHNIATDAMSNISLSIISLVTISTM